VERQILEGCMTMAGFTATQLFRHCLAGVCIYIIYIYTCLYMYMYIYIYIYMHVFSLESGRCLA